MNAAIVIPTLNRPRELSTVLLDIAAQQTLPLGVFVIDASDGEMAMSVAEACHTAAIAVTLDAGNSASLSRQRSKGAQLALATGADVVLFLDDDIRLDPAHLEEIVKVFQRDADYRVGGVSGVSEQRDETQSLAYRVYSKIFMMRGTRPGKILRSGINVPVPSNHDRETQTDWLFGCAAYRAKVLETIPFDESPASFLYEDVVYSSRVAAQWKLVVTPKAKLVHLESPSILSQTEHARQFIVNRYRLVDDVFGDTRGRICFWWSTLGFLMHAFKSRLSGNVEAKDRLIGMISGIRDVRSARSR